MRRLRLIIGIAFIGAAISACSRNHSQSSVKNCTVMKDGKLTQIEHKYCDKLPESKNYPVRGY
jgi:hypothetical protein